MVAGADTVDELRNAGFDDMEIQAWVLGQRQQLSEAGFSDVEIDTHFGKPPIDDAPIQAWASELIDGAMDDFLGAEGEEGKRPDLLELLGKAVESGYQGSATGLYIREQLPDVELSPDAPMIARLAQQASGLVSEFPIMVAGAVMGGAAGTATMGPGLGTIAGAGAGAFGLPAALRQGFVDNLKQGSIDSFEEYFDRSSAILIEAAKGAATGASTLTAGALAKGPLSKFAAELTMMVTVGKGLEGEIPSATDFFEGAVLLFGLKGAVKVAGVGVTPLQKATKQGVQVLHDVYARTGKRPVDILNDIQSDVTIQQDVISMMNPNSTMQVPNAYRSLIEGGGIELPPKPSIKTKVVEKVSAAQQAIRDRISVGEKDAPATLGEKVDQLYTETVDALYPLAKLVKKLADGEDISANFDPYKAARFLPAATAKAQLFLDFEVRRFGSTEVTSRSFKDILALVRDDLQGIREYAVARRAIELNARGVETAVDSAAAKKFVKEGDAKYGAVFEELKVYQDSLTEYLRDSGVISAKMFDKMKEANKDYVPFHRLFDPTETPGVGRGTRVRDPIKKIKGSERKIVDPLESIIKNTYLYTALAERNAVNVNLVELTERKGGTGEDALVRKVKQPQVPTTIAPAEMRKIAEEVKKEFGVEFTPEELTIFRARTLQPTDTQFVAFRNGKRELYEVDPDVGLAMNGMDGAAAGMLSKFLTVPAKTLRAGAILNPEFFAKNIMRDTITATIFSTRGFIPFVDTVLGGLSLIKKDTAFRDWMMSGGANATLVSLDRQYLQQSLRKLTEQTGLMSRAINVAKTPLEILRIGSELAENATRLGLYKRKTRGDRSQKALAEGGFESREGTLDFARMGSKLRGYNQISAFFNARIQGYDRLVRAFKDNPVRATALATATITLPSVALWFANHDDPRWPGIPQWQKDLFWIVMTDESIFRIPKPFQPGILFGTLPEHLLEGFLADNPKAFAGIKEAFLSESISSFFPTTLTPIIENIANFSFFRQAPLIPKRLEGLLPQYQYTEYTTELAKKIGQITGHVGITPINVENYVRQWAGGLGDYALKLADKALRVAGVLPDPPKPADTLADIPFVKAFVIRHPSAGGQSIIDFYKDFEKQSRISETFDALTAVGDIEEALEVLALDPNALGKLSGMRRTLGDMTSLVRTINALPDMPAEEKRQLIDQTYRNMTDIAQIGNDVMRQQREIQEQQKLQERQERQALQDQRELEETLTGPQVP